MKYQQHSPPHPGEILNDLYLTPLKLSPEDIPGFSPTDIKKLVNIIDGSGRITKSISKRLSKAFNTSEALWIQMQKSFDNWKKVSH